jgi:hypothetical protein
MYTKNIALSRGFYWGLFGVDFLAAGYNPLNPPLIRGNKE